MKSFVYLLLSVFASLGLTSCLSYSHALGRGWSDEPSSIASRVGLGVVDVVTLPVQAVAVPVIYLSEQEKKTHRPTSR